MGTYYRKLQTVKHALQYYITRPGASGLDLANETISNLYGLLREYRQQKEKLLKQNTKLLAIYTVIIIAHIITAIINQSYRNSLMFYFLSVVSIVYGIDLCSQKFKKR